MLLVAFVAVSIQSPALASKSQLSSLTLTPHSLAAETPHFKKSALAKDVTVLESCELSTRGGASDPPNQVVSALGLFAINYAVTKAFQALDIEFPAMLGGCIILFVFLLLADGVSNGALGNGIFEFLSPGAALLAKWLPVFFVPGLAMLPRAPSLGSGLDVRF